MNFRDALRRFFAGRYGMDTLNKVLFAVTLVLLVALWFWPNRVLEALILMLLIVSYFRCFSRNIAARYRENQQFLRLAERPKQAWRKRKYRFDQRHTYRFYRCPKCRQEVRVPKGKGKINIACPKCGEHFVKKS